jgi:cysteine desulfurase/selenocysteine lyase
MDSPLHQTASMADQFPVTTRHIWLNHAAISPWPESVVRAMTGFVEDNATRGPLDYGRWLATEAQLRERATHLLGTDNSNDMALVANTSTGLNRVARGLDWQRGDSVVFPACEFPSNRLAWQALHARGVEPRPVRLDPGDPERSLIDAMAPSTRLLAVSSVQYDTGLRLGLERLGAACKRQGVLFCIDAIQHLGALPFDIAGSGADFVIAGSHKWLLAPEGLALFWSRPEAREQLEVTEPGWRMYADPFNFERADWTPPAGARRFEPGTLNSAGIHCLNAALGTLLECGMGTVGEALLDRTGWMIDRLAALPRVEVVTPVSRARRAGIVSFRAAGLSAEKLVAALALQDIHAAVRGSLVRLSPHFYTPMEQLEEAGNAIEAMLDRS